MSIAREVYDMQRFHTIESFVNKHVWSWLSKSDDVRIRRYSAICRKYFIYIDYGIDRDDVF